MIRKPAMLTAAIIKAQCDGLVNILSLQPLVVPPLCVDPLAFRVMQYENLVDMEYEDNTIMEYEL